MNREALEKLAKELGITFDDEVSDKDLEGLIKAEQDKVETKKKQDPEFLAKELLKVINQRDELKKDKRTLKDKIEQLEKKTDGLVSAEEVEKLKQQFDDLKKFKEEVDEEKRKEEEKNLSEIEKLKLRLQKAEEEKEKVKETTKSETVSEFQKQLDEFKIELKSKSSEVETLRKIGLENEVIKAASKHKAIKPEHIYNMLKSEFEFDPDIGKFSHFKRDEKGKLVDEKSVEEYVKDFLSMEENDYLVSTDANNNSMHTKETHTHIKTKSNTGDYNTNDPDLKTKAEAANMKIEDYIDVLKIKDEKMKKVKEAKEKSNA